MGWEEWKVIDFQIFTKSSNFFKKFYLNQRYITTLRGHVQAVYQICWSSDSRLLVSGSADSTVKVWNISTKKILNDLPGHADEVT